MQKSTIVNNIQLTTNPNLVTLVDESDQVIGEMERIEAHNGDAFRHRAISVYLFRRSANGKIELLIQRRAAKKFTGAHQWANTVCGNVWPGESYEACAYRRLQVELNITDVQIKPI